MTSDIDGILREQSRYYEDRAPEYDDVWYRRGIYDLGPEANRRWFQETAKLEAALDDFAPSGGVLELAAGTGLFTRHIAPHATRLIAIDAAASALAINRDRLGDDHIEYVQADLFEWEPPDGVRFDAIVFAFLISHVLPERFDEFWHRLAGWKRSRWGRFSWCGRRHARGIGTARQVAVVVRPSGFAVRWWLPCHWRVPLLPSTFFPRPVHLVRFRTRRHYSRALAARLSCAHTHR